MSTTPTDHRAEAPLPLPVTYAVVTRVEEGMGNLAMPVALYRETAPPSESNDFLGRYVQFRIGDLLSVRVPVFQVGEILLLDSMGREVCAPGRKPSKWSVTVEHHDTITEALRTVAGLG